MISGKTDKYRTPFHFDREGATGHFFPDAVISSLQSLTTSTTGTPRAAPTLRHISLDEAKHHIIEALKQFDPSLGVQAEEILAEGSPSLNLREITGQPEQMGVRPSGLRKEDMLTHPDPVQAAIDAETLPDVVNPLPHAVIDYDFNGTLDAVIYLGHEVGHAIADKRQNDEGNTYRDNPIHMEETQAYFTQSIVSNHLCALAETDPKLAHAAQVFRNNNRMHQIKDLDIAIETMSERVHYRAPSALVAETLVNHLGSQSAETTRATTDMLMGGQGPLGINAVLSRAGIETTDNLTAMLNRPMPQTVLTNTPSPTASSPSV